MASSLKTNFGPGGIITLSAISITGVTQFLCVVKWSRHVLAKTGGKENSVVKGRLIGTNISVDGVVFL